MAQMPPSQPDDNSVLLQQWAGLRNTVDPEKLSKDELVRARNVDLDDRGQPHRRRGSTLLDGNNWHSLYATAKGTVLGVRNGVLGKVNPDFSFMPFGGLSTVGLDHLAYVQVGDVMYFSSLTASGQINLKAVPAVVTQWGTLGGDNFWYSPVVHPDTAELQLAQTGGYDAVLASTDALLPPIGGRLFGSPPLATSLAYYNGRIYLASGKTLWATQPFLYNLVDKTKGYKFFETDVTAIGVVQDGLYVGTTRNLWFLSGVFDEMQAVLVSASGIVPGSLTYVPEHLVSPQTESGGGAQVENKNAVVMVSDKSILVGVASGRVFDLTLDKYILPAAVRASTLFRQQDGLNQILAVQDSGGDPATAARFGDYVSATLIRNGVPVRE